MPTYAENLEEALGYPVQSPYDIVDLLHMPRPSWIHSVKVVYDGDKPAAGSACPCCGRAASDWELDHQNPWKPFVAAMLAPSEILHVVYTHENDAEIVSVYRKSVEVLFHDPENLWWICRSCNRSKSDEIFDRGTQLADLAQALRQKGVRMRGLAAGTLIDF